MGVDAGALEPNEGNLGPSDPYGFDEQDDDSTENSDD